MARVIGVYKTKSGYANGDIENPTYEKVYTDTTGLWNEKLGHKSNIYNHRGGLLCDGEGTY